MKAYNADSHLSVYHLHSNRYFNTTKNNMEWCAPLPTHMLTTIELFWNDDCAWAGCCLGSQNTITRITSPPAEMQTVAKKTQGQWRLLQLTINVAQRAKRHSRRTALPQKFTWTLYVSKKWNSNALSQDNTSLRIAHCSCLLKAII